MSLINSTCRFAAVIACAGFVSGCGGGLSDSLGFGKYSPDETQVKTNQALTLPPDLQLRAPGQGQAPQAPVQQAFAPNQPVNTTPPQYGTVAPSQPYSASQPVYQQTATAPAQVQGVNPPAATQQQDIYAKWGISKYRADGTEKSKGELNNELRKVSVKQKQAQNPNYGSIFNLPNVWSD